MSPTTWVEGNTDSFSIPDVYVMAAFSVIPLGLIWSTVVAPLPTYDECDAPVPTYAECSVGPATWAKPEP